MSAFGKTFGGTVGIFLGIGCGIVLLLGLLAGGCSLLVGGCAFVGSAADEARQAAERAAEEAKAREAESPLPGTPEDTDESVDDSQESGNGIAEESTTPERTSPPDAISEGDIEPNPEYRTWTTATGTYQVEAAFRGVVFGKVKLQRRDSGNIIEVPLDKLSEADQEWIRDRGRRMSSISWLPSSPVTPGSSGATMKEPTKSDPGSAAEAWAITRKFVTDQLRSPTTADFPWSPTGTTKLGPGKWRIAGYVDSQNAFGATLRTEFTATVETRDGTKWSLVDLQMQTR